ncbi:hypothetical protein [Plantibacter sp. YIM 135347]|uniref:hypothetical protein n=1 Tax=Plantibacter sp. YIM 135347 TaxID=3423919 RepID=UPI003D33C170
MTKNQAGSTAATTTATDAGRVTTPIIEGRVRSSCVAGEAHTLTLRGAIHGELIKLVSIRSTLVTLAMIAPLAGGFTWISAYSRLKGVGGDPAANLDSVLVSMGSAVPLTYLLVIMVAVLSITTEYATGQIGATHTVAPRRGLTVLAKSTALALVVWAVSFLSMLAALGVAAVTVGGAGPLPSGTTLSTILVFAAGAATAMTMIGIIALCIGGVLRSTAFGIACAFGLILVLPGLVALAPARWINDLWWLLPDAGAKVLYEVSASQPILQGVVVLAACGFVGLGTWFWTMLRR